MNVTRQLQAQLCDEDWDVLHSRGKRAQTNQIDRPFQVHVVQLKRYTYGQQKTDAEFFF